MPTRPTRNRLWCLSAGASVRVVLGPFSLEMDTIAMPLVFWVSYQVLMKESSWMPLFDLKKLNSSLPPPSVPKDFIEILIMGSHDDFIADAGDLNETV